VALLACPALQHYPCVLTQRDFILGPALDCRPIRSNRRGVILEAGQVFGDAISSAIPNVDAKGKVGLRLHEANPTRLAQAPHYLYAMLNRPLPTLDGGILRTVPDDGGGDEQHERDCGQSHEQARTRVR
jgi:hypothetical protein